MGHTSPFFLKTLKDNTPWQNERLEPKKHPIAKEKSSSPPPFFGVPC